MVSTRKKGFVRHSEYIEMNFKANDHYSTVVEAAAKELHADLGDGVPCLMRVNGSRILDRPIPLPSGSYVSWTLGAYVKHIIGRGSNTKLGLAFVDEVSFHY